MPNYTLEFITVATAHALAVASPGPDFSIVLRQSFRFGRSTAIWTSIGIAVGILLHVSYTLLGVAIVIKNVPAIFLGLQLLAAVYLFWLGIKSLKSASVQEIETEAHQVLIPSRIKALATGFLTNALNVKATLFFLALFTVVIQQQTPLWIQVLYGLWMCVMTGVWFSLVSVFLTQEKLRQRLLHWSHWIDRMMGIVLIGLALRVFFNLIKTI